MRVCVGRARTEAARKVAQQRLDAGDPAAALVMLRKLWDETADPSLLAELAEISRGQGDCERANRDLDQAIVTLAPVEAVREAAAPGSNLDVALDALRRARASKLAFACTPAPAPVVAPEPATKMAMLPASPATPLVTTTAASPVRPRWPLWAAAGGGALALGGGVALLVARTAQQELERGKYDETTGDDLVRRNERYGNVGTVLTASGVVLAAAGLAYYALVAPSPTAVVVHPIDGGLAAGWGCRF
jgi:hypothetical protein